MTAQQIIETMRGIGANPMFLEFVLDREYSCPDPAYITEEFVPWFWKEQHRLGVAIYKPETNDCDNFSVRAMVDMQRAHLIASPNAKTGISAGLFFYQPDRGGSPHAILVFIYWDGTSYRVKFLEPQPNATTFGEVTLSKQEIQSCLGYLFC